MINLSSSEHIFEKVLKMHFSYAIMQESKRNKMMSTIILPPLPAREEGKRDS